MITLIDGQTGTGKTWLTTRLAFQAWKKGFNIYTNYPLNFGSDEGIMRWHNLDELYHLKNGIIIIDDAIKLLDAQKWYLLPSSFKEKISGHRHDHLDIITNIQNFYQINIDVRRNVHKLISMQSFFRSSADDRKRPLLQIIYAVERQRTSNFETGSTRWKQFGRTKIFILSRLFTRTLYDTFDNIYLDRYICKLKYEKKMTDKRGIWTGKIYSRELVNQGKARI